MAKRYTDTKTDKKHHFKQISKYQLYKIKITCSLSFHQLRVSPSFLTTYLSTTDGQRGEVWVPAQAADSTTRVHLLYNFYLHIRDVQTPQDSLLNK